MASLSRGASLVAVVLCAVLAVADARAQANEPARTPFAGKQLRFLTMGSPGGGYDVYMRTLIPAIERRLGAKLVPINETGAGGLVAMNRIVTAAPDGLTIGLIGGETLVTAQLYKLPGVNYDVGKLVWIARVSAEAKVALFAAGTRFKGVADMVASDKPVLWGGTAKTDGNADFAALMAHASGMKTKIIVGYAGSGGMNLAIENGEIDGRVVSDEAAALFARSGKFRVMTVLARNRVAAFPEIPTLFEAASLTASGARLLDWRAGIAALGRLIVTTPGTPAAHIAGLRQAFAETLADPELIAEIRKRSLSPGFASGAVVDEMVAKTMTMLDEASLVEVRNVVMEKYF